jgi:hypothetical protein
LLLRAAEMMFKPQAKLSDKLDSLAAEIAQFLPIYEIDSSTDPFYAARTATSAKSVGGNRRS